MFIIMKDNDSILFPRIVEKTLTTSLKKTVEAPRYLSLKVAICQSVL
jgi:hypothetical protein